VLTSAVLQAINGVSLAALLFLLASGFTLSFGLMRVVNMAHGAYYLLGGYIGLSIVEKTGSFALALAGGGAAIIVVGFFTPETVVTFFQIGEKDDGNMGRAGVVFEQAA
jgi:branched-chain amino acid transport system permease protein